MRFKVPVKNRVSLHWNHGLWLLLLLLSALLQVTDQVASWRYDRDLIGLGQYWLLFSGNIVHLNWTHWALNMAGLGIVAFFFSAYGNLLQWLTVILISMLFVTIGMYWMNPEVTTYVGLSGVLHGLFIYGALREIRTYPLSGYTLLVLLIGKLAWEFFNGAMPGSEEMTSGHVITDAHLYGEIGGLVVASLLSMRSLFAK